MAFPVVQQCASSAPAGAGKTKVILQASKTNQILYVVPRVQIGESVYKELIDYGITDKIELLTGDKRILRIGDNELQDPVRMSGNITITTLDQLSSIMLGHGNIDAVTAMANRVVIFDEFHEFFELAGLVFLFCEFVKLRQMVKAKTYLMSATANQYFVNTLLELRSTDVVKMSSFNTRPFEISVTAQEDNPFVKLYEPGVIVVGNTANQAQQGALQSINAGNKTICFHSKFTKSDRSVIFNQIIKEFGEEASKSEYVIYSGPIIQASFNISTHRMICEVSTFENVLQRLGRVNRFGKLESGAFDLSYKQTVKGDVDTSGALSFMCCANRTKAFVAFVKANPFPSTLNEIYALYDRFHASEEASKAYAEDFRLLAKKSVSKFANQDFDPVQYPSSGKKTAKLGRGGMRGTSYYVLMERDNDGLKSFAWDAENPKECFTDDLDHFTPWYDERLERKYAVQFEDAMNGSAFVNQMREYYDMVKYKRLVKKDPYKYAMRAASNPTTPICMTYNWTHPWEMRYVIRGGVILGAMERGE